MHRKLFTLKPLRIADRFDAWVEISRSIGVDSDPPKDLMAPFRGQLEATVSDSLSLLRYDADACPVYRLAPQIKKVEWGQYWLYREIGPGAWIRIGTQEFITRPGDILVANADEPFETKAIDTYLHHIWMIPHAVLSPHMARIPRPFLVFIPSEHPVSNLLRSYLDVVAREIGRLTDPVTLVVADHIARLIALAAGAAEKKHATTLQTAKYHQAREYIERNLSAHDLAPERVAAELGISIRQLHLCFEPGGESMGAYVRRRRLEECKAMLESPLSAGRSVMEIAFAWGFSSMPTFYRAFQGAYGAAPLDIRAAAMAALIGRDSPG